MDIEANRRSRKWSPRELLGRVLWASVSPLFRLSPRPFWGWRNFLLTLFGAKISRGVRIFPSAKVFIPWNLEVGEMSSIGFEALIYNLGKIKIGSAVTISQRAHLCAGTHDHRDPLMTLIKSTITVGDNAWICADAFVGPDLEIGTNAVVAARSVVVKSVPPGAIVAGNPAQQKGTR